MAIVGMDGRLGESAPGLVDPLRTFQIGARAEAPAP